jgi:hypothetical protein
VHIRLEFLQVLLSCIGLRGRRASQYLKKFHIFHQKRHLFEYRCILNVSPVRFRPKWSCFIMNLNYKIKFKTTGKTTFIVVFQIKQIQIKWTLSCARKNIFKENYLILLRTANQFTKTQFWNF